MCLEDIEGREVNKVAQDITVYIYVLFFSFIFYFCFHTKHVKYFKIKLRNNEITNNMF